MFPLASPDDARVKKRPPRNYIGQVETHWEDELEYTER